MLLIDIINKGVPV